jgi:hypothetical protein
MSDYKPELLIPPQTLPPQKSQGEFLTWLLAGTLIAVITLVTLVYTYYSTRAGLINIDVVKRDAASLHPLRLPGPRLQPVLR